MDQNAAPPQASLPHAAGNAPKPSKQQLPPVEQLFREAWVLYKKTILQYAKFNIVFILVSAAIFAIPIGGLSFSTGLIEGLIGSRPAFVFFIILLIFWPLYLWLFLWFLS
jgi:hypothetical protein